jgi:PAS domain S-box-containing protein
MGVDREQQHSASPDEMRSILATIPYFVLRVGLDGIVQYVNRTAPGIRVDQVIGTHVTSWVRPEQRGAFQRALDDAIALGKSGMLETQNEGLSGARYITHLGPVFENGRVASLIVVGEDITGRRRAEEALRESSDALVKAGERFRSVIEASPVPFALNDDRRNITYLNPEFVRTFGYTLSEIPTLGDWWPRAYPDPAYREHVVSEWEKRFDAARTSGSAFEPMETVIRAKDGSLRNVIASAASLTEAFAGTHLVVLFDVTRMKQLESERRKLEERLLHALRVQSMGRLAGGVAHDNNNMLSVIVNHTEIALRHVDPSHRVHADLVAIRQAAERSANLTKQLLAHARQQPIAPVVLDIADTVTRGIALLRRLLGEYVAITATSAPDLWRVCVDPTQVEQVLTNLCINARDAIGGAGHIAVDTGNVVWSESDARSHGGSRPGDYVVLSVKDDGCGMSPEVLAHVFEPFFTTKGPGEGTGLGLATVHGIVEHYGGFIVAESSVGRGSTFRVFLPRA